MFRRGHKVRGARLCGVVASLAVSTLVSVRDRVIQSYEDIMKMSI